MKAVEQYVPVVLVLFVMPYKVALVFECVDKVLIGRLQKRNCAIVLTIQIRFCQTVVFLR